MPVYKYRARTSSGAVDKGFITAVDSRTALNLLKDKGLYVTKISERKKRIIPTLDTDLTFGKPVSSRDLSVWANQFTAMYSAGIPISYILLTLSEQTPNKAFRKIQLKVLDDINQGITIADAMSKYPKYFPELMVNMFRVGEEAGVMEQSLKQIVRFYSQEYELFQKIRTAMYYPIIVLLMAFGVTWLLMTRMVPAFLRAYVTMESELPLSTRILIGVSNLMVKHGLLLIILIIVLIVLIIIWSKSERGELFFDALVLRTPVFGELTKVSSVARFCRVLSTLQRHGIDIISALTLVQRSINNKVLGRVIQHAKTNASRGQRIANAFEKSKHYPPLVVNMLRVGEDTGTLDVLLEKAADMYELDVKSMSERLNKMLEPFMNLFLAIVVGGILIAIIVPMFSVYNMVG